MGDGHEIDPAEPVDGSAVGHRAVCIDDFVLGQAEIVRADVDELVLELLRGVEGGATEHDRHAAADRRVGRQACSESGRITRMRSGSICSTSPTTVATRVSCPCPDEVVWIVAVISPSPSTLMRQESIQVVVVFFSIEQRLERGVAAARLEARGDADAGKHAGGAQPVALAFQLAANRRAASTLSTTV